MKVKFKIVSWTQNITTPAQRGTNGAIITQPVGDTTFNVNLITADINNVDTVVGTAQVTLGYLTNHTSAAELEVAAYLYSKGLISSVPLADPLDEAKRLRWERIIAIRDGLEGEGFTYLGKTFDSDQRSMNRINTAAQAAVGAALSQVDFTLTWTCADNTTIDLTRDQIIGMPAALASHANDIHNQAKALRAQLDTAITIDEVLACKWPGVE